MVYALLFTVGEIITRSTEELRRFWDAKESEKDMNPDQEEGRDSN